MVQIFGKLPEPEWSDWDEQRRKCFDKDGEHRKEWESGITLVLIFLLQDAINHIGIGEK